MSGVLGERFAAPLHPGRIPTSPRHLLLFDVDSVLVDAQGYLKALQDTVAHFSRRMGVGEHPPTEEEVRAFEANGLGNEWSSAATCLAALLLERLRKEPSLSLPSEWTEALSVLAAHPSPLPHPDYASLARRVGERLGEQADAAQVAGAVLWDEARTAFGPAPARATVAPLIHSLLGHTSDFYRAPVTRYFQHLVVGSQAVADHYAISPDFESPAYLRLYDRSLLAPAARAHLREGVASGQVGVALYTARPSLPPVDVDEPVIGYSPEAEVARSLVGLEEYPLIGAGRLQWLARRVGWKAEQLIKPSPVQALAAIGTALLGQEAPALEAALALHRDGELRPPLAVQGPVTVHVFEDIAGGLAAVERSVDALRAAGVTAEYRPYGIVAADGPKAAAMAARDVPTYRSVNEAILAALKTIT